MVIIIFLIGRFFNFHVFELEIEIFMQEFLNRYLTAISL